VVEIVSHETTPGQRIYRPLTTFFHEEPDDRLVPYYPTRGASYNQSVLLPEDGYSPFGLQVVDGQPIFNYESPERANTIILTDSGGRGGGTHDIKLASLRDFIDVSRETFTVAVQSDNQCLRKALNYAATNRRVIGVFLDSDVSGLLSLITPGRPELCPNRSDVAFVDFCVVEASEEKPAGSSKTYYDFRRFSVGVVAQLPQLVAGQVTRVGQWNTLRVSNDAKLAASIVFPVPVASNPSGKEKRAKPKPRKKARLDTTRITRAESEQQKCTKGVVVTSPLM